MEGESFFSLVIHLHKEARVTGQSHHVPKWLSRRWLFGSVVIALRKPGVL